VYFGTPRPYPAYLREHSSEYGTYHGGRAGKPEGGFGQVPGFRTGAEILRESAATREREVAHEDAEEVATPTRRFSHFEITSGLPDDSREEDEREVERRLRDLRGRVKRARAVVSTTPGLAETLQRDRQMAARFYARFGVTEEHFRHGVPVVERELADSA